MPQEDRKPWWLLPNLLSLDAPLVALAWLFIYERCWKLYIQWPAYACLGLAVWVIYVADRLFDAGISVSEGTQMAARHQFHWRHRVFFRWAGGFAAIITLALTILRMPSAIYAYIGLGLLLVAAFFGLAMVAKQEHAEIPHLKNAVAGITFAYGTTMTANLYRHEYEMGSMLTAPEFICFAVLCVMNISAIDLWEHAARSGDAETGASDELALTLPLTLLGGATLYFAVRANEDSTRPFFYAILMGAALLYILNRNRTRLSPAMLRVLADAALLMPAVLVLPPV